MRQKKNLRIWQFIVLAILLLTMLTTMFMPAFRINGAVVKKMAINYDKMMGESSDVPESILQENSEDLKEIDAGITLAEKTLGIKLSSITPIGIMTFNASKFMEKLQLLNYFSGDLQFSGSKNNPWSVGLIALYSLTGVLLIFVIISFFTKIHKAVPLSICITYGTVSAIVFGYLRFGLMRTISKDFVEGIGAAGYLFGGEMRSELANVTTNSLAKVMSPLYSVSFLIGFIFSILLVIMSIVCIFVGGSKPGTDIDMTDGGIGSDWEIDEQRRRWEWEEQQRRQREEEERRRREELEKQKQAAAAVGVVQCVKGVAFGQGFRIPADKKVVVGKSAQRANFIVNDPKVSNIHCSIRYNPQDSTYVVIDHSSNGTYVNGNRLQKDVAMLFKAGTVISLADDNNQIKLG